MASAVLCPKGREKEHKKYIGIDSVQGTITHSAFNIKFSQFQSLKERLGTNGKGPLNFTFQLDGKPIETVLTWSRGTLRATSILYFNGFDEYRKRFSLPAPIVKSTDGNTNFLTDDEIAITGVTPFDFALGHLPGILHSRFDFLRKDIFDRVQSRLHAVAGFSGLVDASMDKSCAFQKIEVANDIRIPKSFDPTRNESVLRNFYESTRELVECDYLRGSKVKHEHVAASEVAYLRGTRQVRFVFYEKGLTGQLYVKVADTGAEDHARFELTFLSNNRGSKTDTLAEFSKGRSFTCADDIKKIFEPLISVSRKYSVNLLHDVVLEETPPHATKLQLEKVINDLVLDGKPCFSHQETQRICHQMIANRLKIHLGSHSRNVQDIIRELARRKLVFREAFPKSGDYVFERPMLKGLL